MKQTVRSLLAEHDHLRATERLLNWTVQDLADDLCAYPDVRVDDAIDSRDFLLSCLRSLNGGEP